MGKKRWPVLRAVLFADRLVPNNSRDCWFHVVYRIAEIGDSGLLIPPEYFVSINRLHSISLDLWKRRHGFPLEIDPEDESQIGDYPEEVFAKSGSFIQDSIEAYEEHADTSSEEASPRQNVSSIECEQHRSLNSSVTEQVMFGSRSKAILSGAPESGCFPQLSKKNIRGKMFQTLRQEAIFWTLINYREVALLRLPGGRGRCQCRRDDALALPGD